MRLTPDEIPPCCPALQSCCSCVSAFSLSLLNLKEDFPFWFFFIFLKKKIKRRRFWCPITGINVSLLEMLHQFKKKMWTLPGSYLEIKIKLNLLLISINRLIPNHMTSESGGKGQGFGIGSLWLFPFEKAEPVTVTTRWTTGPSVPVVERAYK